MKYNTSIEVNLNHFTFFCKQIANVGILKIVTVGLMPESEKQLAPGVAAFQNCWR